jgi:peptide/nickel transport system permease protein
VVAFVRRNPLVLVGAAVVVAWLVVSIAAPMVTPYGPLTQRVADRLHAPSALHPFGTDAL